MLIFLILKEVNLMNIKAIVLSVLIAGLGVSELRSAPVTDESDERVQEILSELVKFCEKAKERCALEMFVYTVKEGKKIFEEEITQIGSLQDVLDNKCEELSAEKLATAKAKNRCQLVDRSHHYVYVE
jgi:hypothetical protein